MKSKYTIVFLILTLLFVASSCNLSINHTHDYVESVETEATCTEEGVKQFKCSCGDSYTESIPAKGHSWDEGTITTEATCMEEGVETFKCTVCEETKTEPIPMIEHSWDDGVVSQEPTCTVNGTKTFTCNVCNETKNEDILAEGHEWDNGTSTTATCTQPGTTTYTCSKCNETKQESVSALGHDFVGIKCSRCSDYSVTLAVTQTQYTDSAKTDGLQLVLNSLTHSESNGYNRYSINYTVTNVVSGSICAPGIFKIIYLDESGNYQSEFQTGISSNLYYPNSITKSYTWTLAGTSTFVCIEYIPSSLMGDYIFSDNPTDNLLNWIVE